MRMRSLTLLISLAIVIATGTAHADYQFTDFTPPGSTLTYAYGINNAGHVVGEFTDAAGDTHAFEWNGQSSYTSFDAYTGPIPPNFRVTAYLGVNNSEQTIGFFRDGSLNTDVFLKDGPNLTILNPLNADGLNDDGQIVGSVAGADGKQHPFIETGSTIATFGLPAGAVGAGFNAINNDGKAVGTYTDAVGNFHGLIENGGALEGFDVSGASDTQLLGVNIEGVIVGRYRDVFGWHAFVKDGATVTTLNPQGALLGIPSFRGDSFAWSINDSGEIAGSYYNGQTFRGFIATPGFAPPGDGSGGGDSGSGSPPAAPEPASVVLMGVGGVFVCGLRYRKHRRVALMAQA